MNITPQIYIRNALAMRSNVFQGKKKEITQLLKSGFLLESKIPKGITINIKSATFINSIIAVAEEDLKEKFPLNIKGSQAFITKYERWLQTYFKDNIFNAFKFIIEPFKIQSLVKLHNEGHDNLLTFYYAFDKNDKISSKGLWQFEEHFFEALFFIYITAEQICKILKSDKKSKKETSANEKGNFVMKLSEVDFKLGLELYHYGKLDGLDKKAPLLALLLAGLYNNGYVEALIETEAIFENNQNIAIICWAAMKNKPSALNEHIISLWTRINKENFDVETVRNYVFTLQKLLEPSLAESLIKRIFAIYLELLALKNEVILNSLWVTLCWHINGYEKQRYNFLESAIRQGLAPATLIKDYFRNFKNPTFFFIFFSKSYATLKSKTNIKLFEDGFEHFVDSAYKKTEQEIFNLISHENINLRIGIISLWVNNSHYRVAKLNLLLLDSETKQLRAAEAIVAFPFGLKELMPSLLTLRKSSYDVVVKYLQHALCILIFESYHDYALKLIKENIEDTQADREFLDPFKQCLDSYEKMRETKKAIKDLDPRSNEKNFFQLYYKLDREKSAQTVDEISNDEHPFLRDTKTIKIVRGNAWKIEGREVAALGHYETSIAVDIRMYKNPDQFEITLNNPVSKF